MSRHNTIVGENINLFSYHHYISTPLLHTILATYSQQLPTPETTPPEEDWHYIQLQSLHCAFLFIHPNIPFPYAHCHATSPSLQHMVHVRKHSHPVYVLFYPFMLNILFDNPISLINNNVGPITHPYYTKQRKGGGGGGGGGGGALNFQGWVQGAQQFQHSVTMGAKNIHLCCTKWMI